MSKTPSYKALMVASCGGYSEDRYRSWPAVAQMLLKRGFTPREAEAIMRSKWTRWAADSSDAKYGQTPVKALVAFLDRGSYQPGCVEVSDLVDMTNSELPEELR